MHVFLLFHAVVGQLLHGVGGLAGVSRVASTVNSGVVNLLHYFCDGLHPSLLMFIINLKLSYLSFSTP